MVLLAGCDRPTANPIEKGQSYVDQAREAAGTDADQKIDMALNLAKAGKLDDARRLLAQIESSQTKLTPATQAKLDAARRELDSQR